MKRIRNFIFVFSVVLSLFFTTSAFAAPNFHGYPEFDHPDQYRYYSGYPTFKIVGVERNKIVTIRIYNLPPSDIFRVEMGPMGTRGIDGYIAGKFDSGKGGEKICTFEIPHHLANSKQISIRLESVTGSGYYAYNWFYNNTTGKWKWHDGSKQPPKPDYSGYPTFKIVGVVRNNSVKIQTHNLPPGDKFNVRMGPAGTKAKDGYIVDVIKSGSGGTKSFTFDIPYQLFDSYKIAISLQSKSGSGYYAYNWFYNNTTR